MSRENSNSVAWTAMAAIGGMLSGVAAVLGLFIAKPDTITILIPQQTLERAGLSATNTEEAAAAAAPDVAVPAQATGGAVQELSAPPPATTAPAPTRMLTTDVSVALISLVERQDRYVATLRFENATPANIGVAVQTDGFARADLLLTDGLGGSCQMIANGESWGSLDTAELNPQFVGSSSPFRIVGANANAQHTVFFNKGRCSSAIAANPASLSIAGTLIVEANNARRAAPLSFDGLTLTHVN